MKAQDLKQSLSESGIPIISNAIMASRLPPILYAGAHPASFYEQYQNDGDLTHNLKNELGNPAPKLKMAFKHATPTTQAPSPSTSPNILGYTA